MPEKCAVIIDKLVEARKSRGMTQKDLAFAVNLPQATIGRLESKKHTPQLDTLLKIAEALNCDIEVVFKV